jgi:hypothetical protein
MLCIRKITATLAGKTLEGSVARGYLQQGILLSLLCILNVDELMDRLSEKGCCTMGNADYIAILNSGNSLQIVSELLQEALSVAQQWCDRTQLSINPQKMVIFPFTGKRDLNGLWS